MLRAISFFTHAQSIYFPLTISKPRLTLVPRISGCATKCSISPEPTIFILL